MSNKDNEYTRQSGQVKIGIEETSEGKFNKPDCIISSVQGARTIFERLRQDHLKRILLYKEIEGLIQGNPPYSAAELKKAGLQHISNFNDMSARATIKRAAQAYWNLLNNSQYIVNFVLRLGAEAPEATYYAQTMSKHWDYVIKNKWKSFITNVATATMQLVKLGVSPTIFPDERDFRWRVVELSKFYVPNQSQSDLDLLTSVCVESEFTVQYLWNVYTEFKDVEESPWDTKQIGKVLAQLAHANNTDNVGSSDWMELERKIHNGDISLENQFSDIVKIVSLFQVEYSGKVSHYMFPRDVTTAGEVVSDFLFKVEDQYENMQEALVMFTIQPGEYTIHGNRGVGHEIYSLAQAKIMLDCSVVDMAKWAATPIIKSGSLNTKDSDQIRFYPGVPTNIGSHDFVQNNLGANVANVVSASQYLQNSMQFNMSYSGSDSGSPDPDQGSLAPSQVKLMAYREFSVLKNNIMHFYSTFDTLVQNMTAKMLRSKEGYPGYEICKLWKDRCIEDGVPESIFDIPKGTGMPPTIDVFATRAAGAGSQVAHLLGLQELQAIAGSFGPREEREYKRNYISATVGPEYISAYMQESDNPDEQAGGASLAGVENAIMSVAQQQAIFSIDNQHRSHFAIHMQLAESMIQSIQQQQMDPVEAASVFDLLIPHLGQHLQALANSPFTQAYFQQAKPGYDQVEQYAILNKKNAAKMQQARIKKQQEDQANQQRVMSEEELKNYQVQNDEQRKDIKLSAQLQRQEEQNATKASLMERKTEEEGRIKRRKVDLDAQNQRTKIHLENTASQEAEADPSAYLKKLNGATPAPADIEGLVKI